MIYNIYVTYLQKFSNKKNIQEKNKVYDWIFYILYLNSFEKKKHDIDNFIILKDACIKYIDGFSATIF